MTRWGTLANLIWAASPCALERLAEELAEQALPYVWPRARRRLPAMTAAEARGYIRARAAAALHSQVEIRMRAESLPARLRPRLADLVAERTIFLVTREATAVATLASFARAA